MNDSATIFVFFIIAVQIAASLAFWKLYPHPRSSSSLLSFLRRWIIGIGFFPIPGMLVMQLAGLAVYHLAVQRRNSRDRELAARLSASGGLSESRPAQLRRTGPAEENPFL